MAHWLGARASERVKELPHPLIPAEAGIQTLPNRTDVLWGKVWIPASAGMSGWRTSSLIRFFKGAFTGFSQQCSAPSWVGTAGIKSTLAVLRRHLVGPPPANAILTGSSYLDAYE
jgi:hypothetical protein